VEFLSKNEYQEVTQFRNIPTKKLSNTQQFLNLTLFDSKIDRLLNPFVRTKRKNSSWYKNKEKAEEIEMILIHF
jgi:hypothetical protein